MILCHIEGLEFMITKVNGVEVSSWSSEAVINGLVGDHHDITLEINQKQTWVSNYKTSSTNKKEGMSSSGRSKNSADRLQLCDADTQTECVGECGNFDCFTTCRSHDIISLPSLTDLDSEALDDWDGSDYLLRESNDPLIDQLNSYSSNEINATEDPLFNEDALDDIPYSEMNKYLPLSRISEASSSAEDVAAITARVDISPLEVIPQQDKDSGIGPTDGDSNSSKNDESSDMSDATTTTSSPTLGKNLLSGSARSLNISNDSFISTDFGENDPPACLEFMYTTKARSSDITTETFANFEKFIDNDFSYENADKQDSGYSTMKSNIKIDHKLALCSGSGGGSSSSEGCGLVCARCHTPITTKNSKTTTGSSDSDTKSSSLDENMNSGVKKLMTKIVNLNQKLEDENENSIESSAVCANTDNTSIPTQRNIHQQTNINDFNTNYNILSNINNQNGHRDDEYCAPSSRSNNINNNNDNNRSESATRLRTKSDRRTNSASSGRSKSHQSFTHKQLRKVAAGNNIQKKVGEIPAYAKQYQSYLELINAKDEASLYQSQMTLCSAAEFHRQQHRSHRKQSSGYYDDDDHDGNQTNRRPFRDMLLRQRELQLSEERNGVTTDEDTMSEMKTGRYWSKEERKRQYVISQEQKRRRELMQQSRKEIDLEKQKCGGGKQNIVELSRMKMTKQKYKQMMDNFMTIQEILANAGSLPDGTAVHPLLNVTTV